VAETAFQSISNDLRLKDETLNKDPYLLFATATDPIASIQFGNELYAQLSGAPAPMGTKYNNAFEALQDLLRKKGFSEGKSPLGVPDSKDLNGLKTAITQSLTMGQPDVIQYLSNYTGGLKGPKQIDTTTKFVTQMTRALLLKDEGDAMRTLTDSYMLAFGMAPDASLIQDFQKRWNAEVRAQIPGTTTRSITRMVPVYDSKTGKQKIGKDGKPMFEPLYNAEGVRQYEPTTGTLTKTPGEGFTDEEQKAFMANYLVNNYPLANWNVEQIGGTAKVLYDSIVKLSQDNYEKVPTFEEASPIITRILGTGNQQVAEQLLQQYAASIRNKASKRFMSIAPDIAAGNDASTFVNDYSGRISAALETSVGIDDPLMLRVLNYQDSKGNFRLPNDFEFNQLIMSDPRRARTSSAINEAVNLAQSLRSQLQIG
jgi:hypothetical protein